MADTREEPSEKSSDTDSTSNDNFSIYTETSSPEQDLQNLARTSTSSHAKGIKPKSSSKKATVKSSKRAANSLNDDQMEELTSWNSYFSREKLI